MADEATPTPISEPTDNPTPNDAPANPPADVPAEKPAGDAPASNPPADQPVDAPTDDGMGATALGGDTDLPADAAGEGGQDASVPEAYELTAPEGFAGLDPEAVAVATPVFKELGLSNDQANKLMPVAGEFAKRITAERDSQILASIGEQRKAWLEEAKADKEIGGTNWDASLASAAKALDQLGFTKGSPLRNVLNDSGLGNHPEMIRAWAKVGKAIGEDSDFVRGGGAGRAKPTDAELFYGKPQK